MSVLTVSDIERLAKAGVQINWHEVQNSVARDQDFGPPPMAYNEHPISLESALLERWKRAPANRNRIENSFARPFTLGAAEHDGKVFVFVANAGKTPTVLEDDSTLYPSDALLANLHLYLEHGK